MRCRPNRDATSLGDSRQLEVADDGGGTDVETGPLNPWGSWPRRRTTTMEPSVRTLFERYQRFFTRSLGGDMDMGELASLYASEFIAASPAGIMTGSNDDQFGETLAEGYTHYRAIGTKGMQIRNVDISPIDEHHCVAHVAWTATYARRDQTDLAIDFDVHYLVQKLDG